MVRLGKIAVLGAFLTLLVAMAVPTQAHAIPTLYTDRASWEAAAPSPQADVDLSGIADGTPVTSISLPFAETLTFDQTLTKRSVPSGGWATWSGCPPACPDVLESTTDSFKATFSPAGSVGAFGLEMEPNTFSTFKMTLGLSDGTSLGQTVDGLAGAKFFGWVGGSIVDFVAECLGGCGGFAVGKMVKAEAVPEPGTLGLLKRRP